MEQRSLWKRWIKKGLGLCAAAVAGLAVTLPVSAIESTTYTYTLAMDMNGYVRTQDAYLPGGTYLSDIELNAPEDLYYRDGVLFIADSGNARIVRYELETGELSYLGEDLLNNPTGVAVAEDGRLFIADYGASELVILSPSGNLQQRIGRPEEVIYGSSPYKPRRVDVDSFGNIFALSEGTYEGILQFNADGTFNGFFGANKTKGLSFTEWFQDTFYTEEQKEKLFFHTPPNIVSLDVASTNLVYSVTQQDASRALKKLNLAGVNVFSGNGEVWGEDNYVDVAVTPQGEIFAVTDTGSIEEFDNDGNLLLLFGGRAASSDRNGLTAVVSAIEVDDQYNVYVLDKERGLIQTFYPTSYTDLIHQANVDYNAGNYDKSLENWTEILRMNPTAQMAHLGYANAMFQMGEYETAAEHYKTIYQSASYSDCYWKIRSQWLSENMATILIVLLCAVVALFALWLVRRKYDFLAPAAAGWRSFKAKHRLARDLLVDPFYMMKHPIDCYYDLKHGLRGGVLSASILYVLAFIVCLFSMGFTSFVFGGGLGYWQDPAIVALTIIAPVFLFVLGSYLISSINDGEGSFKNAYVACAYMFSPYIVFTPILTLLSHVMTNKEAFIYNFCVLLVVGYTLILLYLAVKETHSYTPGKTIGNLLLTVAFIIIAVLALIILYILWNELLDFLSETFEEVRYRAFS